jgi:N-sulfoglucosamine sulfohydrolase
VFFFPDHGLGIPRYKRTLYDTGIHVPLLVRFPPKYQALASVPAAGRTDQLVSFVDLPPTVLNLAGVPVPSYMQGQVFLGRGLPAPREYIFATHSRVDEAYDMSRCVRDKRYKYIRNFMPHLPYVQPSDYCDQAEIMQELRRVAREGRLAGIEKLFWQPTKPVEELYDTQTDPNEVKNLAGSPAHEPILSRMRKRLLDWMVETRDTELLPEAEMHIRSAGSTPYEMAQDPKKFPQGRILAAAELVGTGPRVLPALKDLLQEDPDSAVRYWAAVGLDALGPEAAAATDALSDALDDPSPNVRFTAAGVLCRLGSCDAALPVLAKGLLDPREVVVLYAARTLQGLGDKARPLVLQMQFARDKCKNLDGSYRNDNYAMFIDWALMHAQESCKEQE